jgi:hypothetical protein
VQYQARISRIASGVPVSIGKEQSSRTNDGFFAGFFPNQHRIYGTADDACPELPFDRFIYCDENGDQIADWRIAQES